MTSSLTAEENARYQQLRALPKLPRFAPQTLRAAWWALRAMRRARKDLKTAGLQAKVAAPPRLPWGARFGVIGVLDRADPTCLERALVLQKWLEAHDVLRDVVIGVKNDEGGKVAAHAWVEGVTPYVESVQYREIHRLAPESAAS